LTPVSGSETLASEKATSITNRLLERLEKKPSMPRIRHSDPIKKGYFTVYSLYFLLSMDDNYSQLALFLLPYPFLLAGAGEVERMMVEVKDDFWRSSKVA